MVAHCPASPASTTDNLSCRRQQGKRKAPGMRTPARFRRCCCATLGPYGSLTGIVFKTRVEIPLHFRFTCTCGELSCPGGIRMLFGLLGSVLVHDGEAPIALGRRRQQVVLLAALALRAGTWVDPDALAELVWDGTPPAGAATTLRTHVHRLRRDV